MARNDRLALLDNPEFVEDMRSSLETREVLARKWGVGTGSISKYRKEYGGASAAERAIERPSATPNLEQRTTEQSSDGSKSVEFIRDRPITLQDAREWIESSGDDPADYVLSVRSIAYGPGLSSNRMSAVPKRGMEKDRAAVTIDPLEVLAKLRERGSAFVRPAIVGTVEDSAFVISINDIQLGQSYNGGSARVIEQFHSFIHLATLRIDELRGLGRRLSTLVIIGGGDLVEGCVIYGNQSFSLDLNRKQQIEGVVALILHAIDTLGPLFEKIKVLAARGNHGENRINGKYTTLDDNDDTHAFEMCKLALARDPEFKDKIEWTIAESEAGVWCEVFDWVLATTHGDIYAKGVAGATIDKKAHAWMKNMALGRKRFGRLGDADVLIAHHFHHDKMSDWGGCLWRQTSSQDNGSPYFEQATGEYSEPGMLSFVMTESVRYQDESVLRVP